MSPSPFTKQDRYANAKKFKNNDEQLKAEVYQGLKKVVNDYPNAPICLYIRDALDTVITPTQSHHIDLLEERLSPNTRYPETPLLKDLRKIVLEYQVKQYLLNAAYKKGNSKDNRIPYFGKLTESKMDEYWMVLNFDKNRKLNKLAQNSNERELAEIISSVSASFPIFSAHLYDIKTIHQELKNPANPADIEAAKVIHSYYKKREQLK